MFSLGDGTKFWLYSKPTDMRKNFNMLSGIVNNHMGQNLYSGDVFVFVNSANNMMKLLRYEPGGLVIYNKRLKKNGPTLAYVAVFSYLLHIERTGKMTAEEQKKMQALETENAALKERLLIAQRTLAKYAQMLFGQKTERVRLPEKPQYELGKKDFTDLLPGKWSPVTR